MEILKKIKEFFLKILKKEKKLSLEEMIKKLNNEYYYRGFNSNLVDELYTKLYDYGPIQVFKYNDLKYDMIFPYNIVYTITEDGIKLSSKSKSTKIK